MDTTECKVCAIVKTWLKQPYRDDGSVIDWFLFVGLIGAISWLWTRIILRIN